MLLVSLRRGFPGRASTKRKVPILGGGGVSEGSEVRQQGQRVTKALPESPRRASMLPSESILSHCLLFLGWWTGPDLRPMALGGRRAAGPAWRRAAASLLPEKGL